MYANHENKGGMSVASLCTQFTIRFWGVGSIPADVWLLYSISLFMPLFKLQLWGMNFLVLRPSFEFPSGSIGDLYAPILGKFRINGVWDLKLTHRPSLVDHGWMMVSQANRLNIGQRSFSKVSNVCLECGYLDAFWGSSIRSTRRTIIALRDVIVVWKYFFWGSLKIGAS
jgi:hypothetical protein